MGLSKLIYLTIDGLKDFDVDVVGLSSTSEGLVVRYGTLKLGPGTPRS